MVPTPDQILFRCHACRQKYAVQAARIGTRTKCKKCQVVMQVPKENALDRPEASKPTVQIVLSKAAPKADHESIAELSFDDFDPVTDSMVVDEPAASAIRHAHENDPPSGIVEPSQNAEQKVPSKDLFDATPPPGDSTAGQAAPKSAPPPGKKLCPNCAHACPSMALACPICQHRFELPKPKPKPQPQTEESPATTPKSPPESGAKSDAKDGKDAVPAPAKSGARLTLKPKMDPGKILDQAITERKKSEGRPVEPPLWMDEAVYGIAFKMGFAGLCCLVAGIIIFIQLDSPQSARNAFFLIKWIYAIGGRWVPPILCLAGAAAFLFFAIKPVVEHIRREKARPLTDQTAKAAPLTDE